MTKTLYNGDIMAEVIVTDPGEGETSPAEASAHEAAVAEGMAAVHADTAADHVDEAKAAAEAALTGAAANMEAAAVAQEAKDEVLSARDEALEMTRAIHDAVAAQGTAIETLLSEFRESRKPAPKPEPVEKTKDETPGQVKKKRPPHVLFGR